jgi:hypothetical protein
MLSLIFIYFPNQIFSFSTLVATVLVPEFSQAKPTKPAFPSYFIIPYGISCEPCQLCPQTLMARVLARTGWKMAPPGEHLEDI